MDCSHADLPINELTCGRSEVLHGPERRRRWTLEQKSRIVAEAFAPGAVTSWVARRHGVHPNQLYAWRREVREAMGGGWDSPAFAPVVVAPAAPVVADHRSTQSASMIEVEIAGAVVRVTRQSDLDLMTAVVRALKAAA
jgi:transposase